MQGQSEENVEKDKNHMETEKHGKTERIKKKT